MRCWMRSKACRARRCPHRWWKSAIFPARIAEYEPAGLDTLIAAGEVAWAGVEPIGERDGRIALFLADKLPLLAQQRPLVEPLTEREEKLIAVLESPAQVFLMRCIRQRAAAIRVRRSRRCGAWCGAG